MVKNCTTFDIPALFNLGQQFIDMKLRFALPAVLSLLQLSCSIDARKEPAAAEYWKMVMKEDPMPQAISNLINARGEEPSASVGDRRSSSMFVRDFDVRPNVIIYHSHTHLKRQEKGSSILPNKDHGLNGMEALGHRDEESLT
ncbi:hypothetical protein SAY87_024717 [Trapa incisa]|uniref:Uncharacterized protein n=1 Tax=Trapa incisa TaxID=236973 RepID=A0AAN7JFB0_9MYRT|nr:hypothetical protein SAY87_024717 [Trapa incisa]